MTESNKIYNPNKLVDSLIKSGNTLAIQTKGYSMFPTLQPGDIGIVNPVSIEFIKTGMIVVFRKNNHLIAHRLIAIESTNGDNTYICRGDNNSFNDSGFKSEEFIGIIQEYERKGIKRKIKHSRVNHYGTMFYGINRTLFRISNLKTKAFRFNEIYFNQWRKILKHSNKDLIQNLVITFFQSVLPLAMIYLVKIIVDQLSNDNTELNIQSIFWLLAGAGLTYLLNGIMGEIRGYYQEKLTQSVTKHTYSYIQDIHKELEYKNYEIPDSLNLIHQAAYESSFRPIRMINNGMNLFRAIISSLLILFMFISINWNFIFILILAILPRLILKIRFAKKYFNFRKSQSADERAMFYYNRVITTQPYAKEMRLFDIAELFRSKFESTQENVYKGKLRILSSELPLATLAQIFGIVLIFSALGKLVLDFTNNLLSLGSLVLVFFLFQRAFSTLNDLFQSLANLVEDYHFLKILKSFEDLTQKKYSSKHYPRETKFTGLKVQNVDFSYPQNSKLVLRNINLEVKPNETIALVGANGSGKTTLIKLLAGLYPATRGEIIMNDENYNKLDYSQISQNITAVFQDYASYYLTAAENISLGNVKNKFDLSKIANAAKQADMDQHIENFEHKYHQMMGNYFDESVELSIGQWQKMAIARAIYSEAPLLLLDEPTSALDAASELHIVELMHKMTKDRTTIIVSHHLSMVEWVDKIYCFKDGEIVEEGTHKELTQLDGEYARLYAAHHQLKS